MNFSIGRPSLFNNALAEVICERIARGESVAQICASEGMPSLRTVWRWKRENEEFRHDYEEAKEACAEYYASRIMAIADDLSIPVSDRKLMVEARKWCAGRMRPKSPTVITVEPYDSLTRLTPEQLQAKKAEIMGKLKLELMKEEANKGQATGQLSDYRNV